MKGNREEGREGIRDEEMDLREGTRLTGREGVRNDVTIGKGPEKRSDFNCRIH
jgi:hypothetical protein